MTLQHQLVFLYALLAVLAWVESILSFQKFNKLTNRLAYTDGVIDRIETYKRQNDGEVYLIYQAYITFWVKNRAYHTVQHVEAKNVVGDSIRVEYDSKSPQGGVDRTPGCVFILLCFWGIVMLIIGFMIYVA